MGKQYFHQSLFLRDDHQRLSTLCGTWGPQKGLYLPSPDYIHPRNKPRTITWLQNIPSNEFPQVAKVYMEGEGY